MALILSLEKFGMNFQEAYWKITAYRKEYTTGTGIITVLVYASEAARLSNPDEPLRGFDFLCTTAEIDALMKGADDREGLYEWLKVQTSETTTVDFSAAVDVGIIK